MDKETLYYMREHGIVNETKQKITVNENFELLFDGRLENKETLK